VAISRKNAHVATAKTNTAHSADFIKRRGAREMTDVSKAGQFPTKADIKSVLWNLLMVEGAAATTFLIGTLPSIDFHLNALQTVALTIAMPAVFAVLKLANKWFSDNTKP
jgi:hypothetical protein